MALINDMAYMHAALRNTNNIIKTGLNAPQEEFDGWMAQYRAKVLQTIDDFDMEEVMKGSGLYYDAK